MKPSTIRFLFALILLVATVFACNLPINVVPESHDEETLTSQAVVEQRNHNATVNVAYANYIHSVELTQDESTNVAASQQTMMSNGQTQAAAILTSMAQATNTAIAIQKTSEASFQLTLAAKPPQDANPGTDGVACAQWNVNGTWAITQTNNYHPSFEIFQVGTNLSGSATLPGGEASLAGFSGNVGSANGRLVGDAFLFNVTWPARSRDGVVVTGTYSGTVTQGRIDGRGWFGIGPGLCAK